MLTDWHTSNAPVLREKSLKKKHADVDVFHETYPNTESPGLIALMLEYWPQKVLTQPLVPIYSHQDWKPLLVSMLVPVWIRPIPPVSPPTLPPMPTQVDSALGERPAVCPGTVHDPSAPLRGLPCSACVVA